MKSRCGLLAVLCLALCATVAYCQTAPAGPAHPDFPHWPNNETGIVVAVVPPAGSVPETDQWPAAARLEINDVPFVIYAKHLDGYDPAERQGKFAVWLSVPAEQRRTIEQTRPFSPADAHAYLRSAGVNTLTAQLYTGRGDHWGDPPPGCIPWTANSDRLLVALVEPAHGAQQLPAFGLTRILADGRELTRVRVICRCPKYDDGETRRPDEMWIGWRRGSQTTNVDQWGLPGNSPAPAQQQPTQPVPPGGQPAQPEPVISPGAEPFVRVWIEQSEGLLLSVFGDGTWAMFNTQVPQTTPRAGTWGLIDGRLTLRTCLSSTSQLWRPEIGERTAQALISGAYDLTMVYDLALEGDKLAGTCRTWRVTAPEDGRIDTFMGWQNPGNSPSPVVWSRVHTVYPPIQDAAGQAAPATELQRMLDQIPPTGIGLPAHKQARETAQEVGGGATGR
jgi:hypothetical protein